MVLNSSFDIIRHGVLISSLNIGDTIVKFKNIGIRISWTDSMKILSKEHDTYLSLSKIYPFLSLSFVFVWFCFVLRVSHSLEWPQTYCT